MTLLPILISHSGFTVSSESTGLFKIPSGSSRGTMKRDDLKEPPVITALEKLAMNIYLKFKMLINYLDLNT